MGEGSKGEALQKLGKLLEDIGVVVKVERARIIGRKNREGSSGRKVGRLVVWAKLEGLEDKKRL